MQSEEFNEIIRKRIAKSTDVLVKKAGEYADDGDRLHNFRAAAGLTGQSMREALGGMMLKHTVSIYDMIRNADVDYPQEMWDEKLGDHLNYLLLLEAVVADEKRQLAEKAAQEYLTQDANRLSEKDREHIRKQIFDHQGEDPSSDETDEICPTFNTFKEFAEVYPMPNCVRPVAGDETAEVAIAGRYYVFNGMTSTEAAYPRFDTVAEYYDKFGPRLTAGGSVSDYDVYVGDMKNPFRKLI